MLSKFHLTLLEGSFCDNVTPVDVCRVSVPKVPCNKGLLFPSLSA